MAFCTLATTWITSLFQVLPQNRSIGAVGPWLSDWRRNSLTCGQRFQPAKHWPMLVDNTSYWQVLTNDNHYGTKKQIGDFTAAWFYFNDRTDMWMGPEKLCSPARTLWMDGPAEKDIVLIPTRHHQKSCSICSKGDEFECYQELSAPQKIKRWISKLQIQSFSAANSRLPSQLL